MGFNVLQRLGLGPASCTRAMPDSAFVHVTSGTYKYGPTFTTHTAVIQGSVVYFNISYESVDYVGSSLNVPTATLQITYTDIFTNDLVTVSIYPAQDSHICSYNVPWSSTVAKPNTMATVKVGYGGVDFISLKTITLNIISGFPWLVVNLGSVQQSDEDEEEVSTFSSFPVSINGTYTEQCGIYAAVNPSTTDLTEDYGLFWPIANESPYPPINVLTGYNTSINNQMYAWTYPNPVQVNLGNLPRFCTTTVFFNLAAIAGGGVMINGWNGTALANPVEVRFSFADPNASFPEGGFTFEYEMNFTTYIDKPFGTSVANYYFDDESISNAYADMIVNTDLTMNFPSDQPFIIEY